MSEYSIFKPKSKRGLFSDYPELRNYPELQGLKQPQILFVWYYACEASPLFGIEKTRERIEKALDASFYPNGRKLISDDERKTYLSGKFPARVEVAIEAMSSFKIGPRVRAMKLTEKVFENMEKILMIDANDVSHFKNKDGEVDFSKKNAYMNAAAKADDMLPKLIKKLEGKFSVSEDKEKTSTFEGESLIDEYHENQD